MCGVCAWQFASYEGFVSRVVAEAAQRHLGYVPADEPVPADAAEPAAADAKGKKGAPRRAQALQLCCHGETRVLFTSLMSMC